MTLTLPTTLFSQSDYALCGTATGKQVGPVSAPGLTAVTPVPLLPILHWRVEYPKRHYSHILPFLISVSQAPESYLKIMEAKVSQ